ncbi:MAG: hypothetical protein BA864_14430 [Desulfuromonadales bacterium C00003093]|nr:MAG: hypothetical protein BA864_14430 [Desulfuromonadales bacterium C00003093]
MKSTTSVLLKQYAFIVFIVLAVLISWFPWYTTGTGFFVFGPSIAGVIVIAMTSGKEGMRDMGQRALRWHVGFRWWAVALFLTGLVLSFSIAINTVFLGGNIPSFAFLRQEWYLIPVVFLITMIGGPLGEEFGWRGFALPNLQHKWSPMVASIIIGIVWALWHLPLFFQPDSIHAQIGIKFLPVYIIGEIVLAITITWVYNKTGGSLLVGGIILHNADNFWATALLTNDTIAAVQSGEQSQLDIQLYILSTIVGVLVVLIIAIATKWKLGLSEEGEAKEA